MRRPTLVIAVALALTLVASGGTAGAASRAAPREAAGSAGASAGLSAAMTCDQLAKADFSTVPDAPTAVMSAKLVAATPDVAEHCEVSAYVTPQVQFTLKLPTRTWNGRYYQTGCGGYCGSIAADQISACVDAVKGGFAAAATNDGHVSTSRFDGLWAFKDHDAVVDYGYRAVHVVSVASKTIVQTFYGRSPEKSYFQGCSDGGREALMEAQRYPDDFNGIIAGAPAFLFSYLVAAHNLGDQRANRDVAGRQIIGPDQVRILERAVLARCDRLGDGIVSDPRNCSFDPGVVQCRADGQTDCLTPEQVAAARKMYQGPVNRRGVGLYPGAGDGPGVKFPGSEGAWLAWQVAAPDAALSRNGFTADQYLKYFAFDRPPGPGYDTDDFDWNRDLQKISKSAQILNSADPNLDQFHAKGGKLILYHGWGDTAIPPTGTLWYYNQLQQRYGGVEKVQRWARLFMLPGVYHCNGGPGPDQFDFLGQVVAWVEQGAAPNRVVGSHLTNGAVDRTRPVFPYPTRAEYSGHGDVNNEASFVGVTPSTPPDDDFRWIIDPRS
ncbi:tannase/feruloyl esterase family alpha/beta hydrolase [Microtetraspora malaysiensis]|uniref:tannase/feruloyl esterase family alpha/beta hydrolase n=1 Tax=Microtetraspora malaysiensis TaxID=161358 RepID=UPI003D8DA34F